MHYALGKLAHNVFQKTFGLNWIITLKSAARILVPITAVRVRINNVKYIETLFNLKSFSTKFSFKITTCQFLSFLHLR